MRKENTGIHPLRTECIRASTERGRESRAGHRCHDGEMDQDKRDCENSGMRDFVSKPICVARLQSVLGHYGLMIKIAREQDEGWNQLAKSEQQQPKQ